MSSSTKFVVGGSPSATENFKVEQKSYFEIHRTPPDEKRRAEKVRALMASQEIAYLNLTPFTTIPRISFDNIKLGTSAVRQLVVRNPGTKELTVCVERPPLAEKGFALDYLNFRLGGREETTLHIGWTPQKGGGVRDNINIKFGGFRTQVILIGDCKAPVEKKQFRPPPRPLAKPLGVRNSQKTAPSKEVKTGKAVPPVSKITIPPNPIVIQNVSPPKRIYASEQIEVENRRETFVRERPTPTAHDIIQSTPKNDSNDMGPPNLIPQDRRQTYLPHEVGQVCVDDKENRPVVRRETYKVGKGGNAFLRKATYVKQSEESSWTPQKPIERKKWIPTGEESLGNLSGLRNLHNDSNASTVFGDTSEVHVEEHHDVIPEEETSPEEPEDLSINLNQYSLSPEKNLAKIKEIDDIKKMPAIVISSPTVQEPLNLSVKKNLHLQIYQPDVSDISLAECDLNVSKFDDANCSMAVNMSGWKSEEKRLDEFSDQECQDEKDLEKELDDEIERLAAQRGASGCRYSFSETEEVSKSDEALQVGRLSSGTVTKPFPLLEAELLPDCTDISLAAPQLCLDPVNLPEEVVFQFGTNLQADRDVAIESVTVKEDIMSYAKEVVTEQVIEEVVEYEYEIRDGVKKCVAERNVGKTVTTQETERMYGTPTKQTNMYEKITYTSASSQKKEAEKLDEDVDNISKLIEENLGSLDSKTSAGCEKLSDSELDGMLGMLALSQQNKKLSINTQDSEVQSQPHLPGLKGSPKVSNQLSAAHSSFLHKTVSEANFQPPSPDDPRRCSTGIKDKNKDTEQAEPSSSIKKSLFQTNIVEQFKDVHLSSGGYVLPVIADPVASQQECRLSSDTYIATDDVPPLSIIQEMEENQTKSYRKNNTTSDKNNSTTNNKEKDATNSDDQKNTTEDRSKSYESIDDKTIKSRAAVKAGRVNAMYAAKPIEQLAISKPIAEEPDPDGLGEGLMFVALSPEKQEKRKSAEAPAVSKSDTKKTRYSVQTLPRTNRQSSIVNKSKAVTRRSAAPTYRPGSNVTKSSDAKVTKPTQPRRSVQPSASARLNLTKARHSTAAMPTATRPNPFASRNRYYDERWIEKQEKGFCNWLNFILTPQSLDVGSSEDNQATFDIAKLWAQCSQGVKVPRAPTREVMSIRAYTVNREMNRLRRAACKLWQSRSVVTVVQKLELEIEKLRIVIRKDKQINKDVGMKQSILSLILSYNPLWLRLALETVYGEVLVSLHGNSDILGISRFLITRFLSCPNILQEYAHPTVPHSYRDGHQEALNKFTLKKFLEIVYLLDQAKESRLIQHNPCLFCPDSKIKSSREILTTFSKDYLSGEGDIIKHLSYLDYVVTHKQTTLHEFDYAVTSISTDLRCGLRLTKVAELMTGADLSRQLRVPTVSRLQKVHNNDVALKKLRESNSSIPANILSKDIVDGHREKTLTLLWNIIFGFQLNDILDEDKLRCEILHLRKSLRLRVRLRDQSAVKGLKFLEALKCRTPPARGEGEATLMNSSSVNLLKEWAQLVTAHYNVEIENWTVSWCDGRGLCFLMHHYQPALVSRQDICQETSVTSMSCSAALDDSLEFSYGNQNMDKDQYNHLLDNEKKNFKLLLSKVQELGGVPILISTGDMSNTIPDEKVTVTFIGYLAARLLDISREIKAARTIQLAWRKYYAGVLEERMKVKYTTTQ